MSKSAFAPHCGLVGHPAARLRAAAPLVGEDDLGAVVVERRRVPVREVRVGDRVETNRVGRVADVEQDAVALARARSQPDLGVRGDVMARVRVRARASTAVPDGCSGCVGPVFCRPLTAPVTGSVKMRGWLTIAAVSGAASGTLMTSMRHCVGLPGGRPAPLVRRRFAARQLARPADARRARVVDVDVVGVVGVGHERVRVRTAAGLHPGNCTGLLMSLMSKMRTPRKRSRFMAPGAPCVPQSMRPRVSSTDMNSRSP